MVELGYRILNPYPYFSDEEITKTEHGNLSEYDSLLGWKGVPSGKPAIVFPEDSFGWGYEVEFDEISDNIRKVEPDGPFAISAIICIILMIYMNLF